MGLWYRVFGSKDIEPAPAAILEHLQNLGIAVKGYFTGDKAGWYAANLSAGDGCRLQLERFLAGEEGIRAELNTWAAWLETCTHSLQSAPLMEKIIQTRQLFTVQSSDAVLAEHLCSFLAETIAGIWQADGRGFFAADGTLLVEERGSSV